MKRIYIASTEVRELSNKQCENVVKAISDQVINQAIARVLKKQNKIEKGNEF